jgi:hypothetical protein
MRIGTLVFAIVLLVCAPSAFAQTGTINGRVTDAATGQSLPGVNVAVEGTMQGSITDADPEDIDGMIAALEGWTFDAPKGTQTIREGDRAMLQPMFTASLDENFEAESLTLLDPEETAPPEAE